MSVTLLDIDAEPVGGWWPDDMGEPVVRGEGSLHPRVGTVVADGEDLEALPYGTLAEQDRMLVTRALPFSGASSWCICDGSLVPAYGENIIGATILYWPLDKP